MKKSMPRPSRRSLLLAGGSLAWGSWLFKPSRAVGAATPASALQGLEAAAGGRLGVAAMATGNGKRIAHRGDERFPFCSTVKVMCAAAVLQRSESAGDLLQRRILYNNKDLARYSPITTEHIHDGMTVAELCAAALQYSDNTAFNLLLKLLGGTAALTAYARSIGNASFRLDRWETDLNEASPGDPRDTVTPFAMMDSLRRLALADALPKAQRETLVTWMRGNTTGAKRIRAAVPADWVVADKTGTGEHGTTNDIGIVWPIRMPPVVLCVYFTQGDPRAAPREDVVAAATRIVLGALATA